MNLQLPTKMAYVYIHVMYTCVNKIFGFRPFHLSPN